MHSCISYKYSRSHSCVSSAFSTQINLCTYTHDSNSSDFSSFHFTMRWNFYYVLSENVLCLYYYKYVKMIEYYHFVSQRLFSCSLKAFLCSCQPYSDRKMEKEGFLWHFSSSSCSNVNPWMEVFSFLSTCSEMCFSINGATIWRRFALRYSSTVII